jgi:hypothetical protein
LIAIWGVAVLLVGTFESAMGAGEFVAGAEAPRLDNAPPISIYLIDIN